MEVEDWHPGPPDLQTCVMAHAGPQTHEHRHTDIRQTKSICESLKKTPVQLIFSQTPHSSTTLSFILKILKILFHFSSVFEAPPEQKKQTQLKKFISFPPKYIEDRSIDKFWCAGKPSCPPFFSKMDHHNNLFLQILKQYTAFLGWSNCKTVLVWYITATYKV